VSNGYVSPGSSSERIFLYYAPVKTAMTWWIRRRRALRRRRKMCKRVEFTREDFLDRVDAAFFDDAKVMALGFWLKAQPKQGKPAGLKPQQRKPASAPAPAQAKAKPKARTSRA
jgi:hypothetical protein